MSLAAAANARLTPAKTALADERQSISWLELDALLNRGTNRLLGCALRPGERVAVFAQNSVETALSYLAALHAGVSSVPVNFHFNLDEVAYILAASGAKIVFAGPETIAVARAAAARAGVDTIVVWRARAEGAISWNDWLAEGGAGEPPGDMSPQPHLHFTSGTTGQPKGTETPPTMFPRKASVGDLIEALQAQAGAAARSPMMVVSPMYHTGPLSSVRALAGGASLVIMSRFDAEDVLRTIERQRVRSTMMVPTHFQRLLALPVDIRERYDVSSLVNVSHTGAACPQDVKRRMIEWFGPVLTEAYGATESGSTNMITSEEWLLKPGSVGRTLAPFEVVVVAEDGATCGPNAVGSLYFRDATGRGIIYHNDAEKTRSAHLEPGLFTLGEVGYFDDDGYVFITDRSSDMIVSGGVNIYPAETEQVLNQHPGVADVAVIGAPNFEMGEEVKAIIVPLDPAAPPDEAELGRFCRERLAGYKCPRSYEFVADIGRNAMGKINKRELRRRYWPTERTIGG
jgi:long-chain acyl-CoA synthetase